MATTELAVPLGRRVQDGKTVSVEEVPLGNRSGCVCLHCGKPLVAKNRRFSGRKNELHFAHATGGVHCDRNTLLHTLAIETIKRGIEKAIDRGLSYLLRWECPRCADVTTEELARLDTTTTVRTEKRVVERTRSDIFVQWGDLGEHGARAIEVVVTHEPSQATSARYQEAGVHVVIVRVRGNENIAQLNHGITAREGINYPPTPCAECARIEAERVQELREIEAWKSREQLRRAEREKIVEEIIAGVRNADTRLEKAVRAFISPSRPEGEWTYWKENRMGYVRLEPRRRIHQSQQKLRGLGFVQDPGNKGKGWLMEKRFTNWKPPYRYVYVDYGDAGHWGESHPSVYTFKASSIEFHTDHLIRFVTDALRKQDVPMDADDGGNYCVDCNILREWAEYGDGMLDSILSLGRTNSQIEAVRQLTAFVRQKYPHLIEDPTLYDVPHWTEEEK